MSKQARLKTEDIEADPLLRVMITARHVLNDEIRVDMFLHRKQRDLGGKRPIDLAQTEGGAQQVEKLLWAIHADHRL